MSTESKVTPPAPRAFRRKTGRGQKPMIWLFGVVLIAFAIMNEVWASPTDKHGSLWPVFLAIVAFLYLWWLSSLLFDLLFVWHRYIQGDAAHNFLRNQVQRRSFDPRNDSPEPPPPSPAVIPPRDPPGGSGIKVMTPIKFKTTVPATPPTVGQQ